MAISLNRYTPSTTILSADQNDDNIAVENAINGLRPTLYVFNPGGQSVATNISGTFEIQQSLTIDSVDLRIKTAPTGAALIVDINKNGTTIFSTRPQIAAAATSGGGSAVLSVTTLAAGDLITVDIDQVGSSVAGSDLTIALIMKL